MSGSLNSKTRSLDFGVVIKKMTVFVVVLATAFAVLSGFSAERAHADNITDGFNPGNIIADEVFYNGGGYSAQEVQEFLDSMVARCTLGDPGRPAGGTTLRGTLLAHVCLKDFKMDTRSRNADAYCKAYPGGRNESAAEIIAKVGKACNINPKVLLVMLEKEQSLVTDDWPSQRMYNVAMGYACPDSGPGHSANCNEEFYGFFNQMYYGARQLQRYRAHPDRWNYRAGRVNTIQYHPKSECGTSQVYIENAATAGLYVYTPYRPNQAALDAGWGTGDDCSTYGNRNFYNFFKAWFGSTQSKYTVASKFSDYWIKNSDWLGAPVDSVVDTGAGGGLYQEFRGGVIFGAHGYSVVGLRQNSPELVALRKNGFVQGVWGYPLEDPGAGKPIRFYRGLAGVNGDSVYLIPNELVQAWQEFGGYEGADYSPGAPVGDAVRANGSIHQEFSRISLVRDPNGKVWSLDKRFVRFWLDAGGVHSELGHPTENVRAIAGGASWKLSKHTLYMNADRRVFSIPNGHYNDAYWVTGGPAGPAGHPVGATECDASGVCVTQFERGYGVWSANTGFILLAAEEYKAWQRAGREGLGLPVTQATQVAPGVFVVQTERGSIYRSARGAYAIAEGQLKEAWEEQGGLQQFGVPLSDMSCQGNGVCAVRFSGGVFGYHLERGGFFNRSPYASLENPATDKPNKRLGGEDRFTTAVLISQDNFKSADTVVLATAKGFADSLAAAPYAAKLNAPLLLTDPGELNEVTRKEIARLNAKRVVIAGGSTVVPEHIVTQLQQEFAGLEVVRFAGEDRYETSAMIAKAGWSGSLSAVFIATGEQFADALAAAPAAIVNDAPVVLVPGGEAATPDSVREFLSRQRGATLHFAGGESAIRQEQRTNLWQLTGGHTVTYGGVDRYDTAAQIARANFSAKNAAPVYFASGTGYADALSGAVIAGLNKAPLLLVDGECLVADTEVTAMSLLPSYRVILGGNAVVSDGIARGRVCG
ncbi:cell wall-binding repeat-containing protein [Canibacter sp. lx-45]|uniref:cell wall-binding repeat-containing protein n=1 Tax=Canibacter zhuwentaonis TaxID=2837491 RepID=UPI001BDDC662|nr:cell wall-binding repeat-containing protein [Canibacter zhuwentaonis]